MGDTEADLVLHKGKDIRITRTILEVKKTKYQIRNIDTFKKVTNPPDTTTPNSFIIVGVVLSMLVYVAALPDRLAIVGIFLILTGIISRDFLTSTHSITVVTTGGQEVVYTSEKEAEIDKIKAALETAMDRLA